MFDARDVPRFTARDKYTTFEHAGTEYILDHSLADLEGRLSAHDFVRVHRAELVNLAFVAAYDGATHEVVLRDGTRAPVSRRMVADLKRRLGM